MIVPKHYENLNVLHENTMPHRAYYMPASKDMGSLVHLSLIHIYYGTEESAYDGTTGEITAESDWTPVGEKIRIQIK